MRVYGRNVVKELLNNNQKIYKAYLSQDFGDKNTISLLKDKKIEIEILPKRQLDMLEVGNHQGIIVDVPDYKFYSIDNLFQTDTNSSFIVILDHLEDPHNFGAIIRTCEAAGVDGIIIPKDRSVDVNSTVMKVSAGALTNVKICQVTNLNSTIEGLKKRGFWIIGTDMTNSVPYTSIDYNMPIVLIIGNEGSGISNLTSKLCDYMVNIPMKGKINSLNASVAAGIVIYEVIEKRGK